MSLQLNSTNVIAIRHNPSTIGTCKRNSWKLGTSDDGTSVSLPERSVTCCNTTHKYTCKFRFFARFSESFAQNRMRMESGVAASYDECVIEGREDVCDAEDVLGCSPSRTAGSSVTFSSLGSRVFFLRDCTASAQKHQHGGHGQRALRSKRGRRGRGGRATYHGDGNCCKRGVR